MDLQFDTVFANRRCLGPTGPQVPVLPLWRFYLVQRGRLQLRCGRRRTTLDAGAMAVVHPYTELRQRAGAGTTELAYVHLRCAVPGVAPGWTTVATAEPQAVQAVLCECTGRRDLSRRATLALASLVLPAVFSAAPVERAPAPVDARLAQVLRRLEETSDRSFANAELAAGIGMSTGGFIRAFTRAFGRTPQSLHRDLRLQAAADHLHSSNDDVATTGRRFGFVNRIHFTGAFTRCFGVPPGRWRRDGHRSAATAEAAVGPTATGPGASVRITEP